MRLKAEYPPLTTKDNINRAWHIAVLWYPPTGAPLPELPEELWDRILDLFVRDRHSNIVVPALAQLARASRTNKLMLRLTRAMPTPYDADIVWNRGSERGMPVSFAGGVAFGEFRFCFALVIIRHPGNGRMFVVSTEPHPGFDQSGQEFRGTDEGDFVQVVKRHYSFCRLAQLLGGHTADWEKRLADFAHLQHHIDEWHPLQGRTLYKNEKDSVLAKHRPANFIPLSGFVEPPKQLLSTSLTSLSDFLEEHEHDAITYCVRETSVTKIQNGRVFNHKVYQRTHALVLHEAEDGGSRRLCDPEKRAKYIRPIGCWYGKKMRDSYTVSSTGFFPSATWLDQIWPGTESAPNEKCFFFVRPTTNLDPGHATDLSIALGLYSDPVQATGCNWLVSLFNHYDGKYELLAENLRLGPRGSERRKEIMNGHGPYPTWHSCSTSKRVLVRMSELANAADCYISSQAEAPRTQRGAAAKAMHRMHRCADEKATSEKGDEDASDASDASDAPLGKRKRKRGGIPKPKPKPKRKQASGMNSACSVERFLAFNEHYWRLHGGW